MRRVRRIMEGRRGVFSVLLFLLATVSIAALAGAMAVREKTLSDATASAVEGKRLFYAARDIESSFWKSVKIGFSNCADRKEDFESCVKSGYLAEWKKYAENYWLDDGAKFDVFAGKLSGEGDVSEYPGLQWDSPLEITKVPIKVGKITVGHLLKAAITTFTGHDIFVRIDGRDADTYALMKSGESYSCIYVPAAGEVFELSEEYSSLPVC